MLAPIACELAKGIGDNCLTQKEDLIWMHKGELGHPYMNSEAAPTCCNYTALEETRLIKSAVITALQHLVY